MNRKHGFFQAAMRNGTAGFAVLLLAAVFAVGGCDNGTTSDNDSTATYTGTNGGSTYTLTVTNGTAFVLTVGDKTSSGAAVKNGGTYTLTPTDATAFTLTVSGPGIIAISGTITFTDNSSDIVSITLTPPDGDSMKLVGKWLLSGGLEITRVLLLISGTMEPL